MAAMAIGCFNIVSLVGGGGGGGERSQRWMLITNGPRAQRAVLASFQAGLLW
jgi:hypothetical protein